VPPAGRVRIILIRLLLFIWYVRYLNSRSAHFGVVLVHSGLSSVILQSMVTNSVSSRLILAWMLRLFPQFSRVLVDRSLFLLFCSCSSSFTEWWHSLME
jgi:hypothetical protein